MLNAIRRNHLVRLAAVLAALVAWFAVSNRCVLRVFAMSGSDAELHQCCQDKAEEQTPKQKPTVCCKILAVTVPDNGKMTIAQATPLMLPVIVATFAVNDVKLERLAVRHVTGPPVVRSVFVELVLHRSLRAHAPPVLS